MYSALVSTSCRSVSTDTPLQTVSSFDHFVTQWMSRVTVSLGRARNSSQLQETGSSTAPRIVKVHSESGVCGVGPAESTGKSPVTYCPGGTRPGSTSSRRPRPRKPREIGLMAPFSYLPELGARVGPAGSQRLDMRAQGPLPQSMLARPGLLPRGNYAYE